MPRRRTGLFVADVDVCPVAGVPCYREMLSWCSIDRDVRAEHPSQRGGPCYYTVRA